MSHTNHRGHQASWAGALVTLCVFGVAGCALTQKSEPLQSRYFVPDLSTMGPAAAERSNLQLRLHHVQSGTHLRNRIVYRDSPLELGFVEELRWAEHPEVYLRRVLARALFEQRGLRRVTSGYAPTLEVELLAFDEIRGDRPMARIELVAVLHDKGQALLEQTIAVEKPVQADGERGKGFDDAQLLAMALGAAMVEAVQVLSNRVVTELGQAQ